MSRGASAEGSVSWTLADSLAPPVSREKRSLTLREEGFSELSRSPSRRGMAKELRS